MSNYNYFWIITYFGIMGLGYFIHPYFWGLGFGLIGISYFQKKGWRDE